MDDQFRDSLKTIMSFDDKMLDKLRQEVKSVKDRGTPGSRSSEPSLSLEEALYTKDMDLHTKLDVFEFIQREQKISWIQEQFLFVEGVLKSVKSQVEGKEKKEMLCLLFKSYILSVSQGLFRPFYQDKARHRY